MVLKACTTIVHDHFNGNWNRADNISHFIIAQIKVCIQYKNHLNDEAIPIIKKEFLKQWV